MKIIKEIDLKLKERVDKLYEELYQDTKPAEHKEFFNSIGKILGKTKFGIGLPNPQDDAHFILKNLDLKKLLKLEYADYNPEAIANLLLHSITLKDNLPTEELLYLKSCADLITICLYNVQTETSRKMTHEAMSIVFKEDAKTTPKKPDKDFDK